MRYQSEILLRDGRRCLLRTPGAADAEALLQQMRVSMGETDNLLRYPDELCFTPAQEADILESSLAAPDRAMLCAFVGGQLVACIGFSPVAVTDRCRHRATVGLSILRAYWGLGIGTALLQSSIALAAQAHFTQMELDVVEENTRARALYTRLGFQVFGCLPNGFRYRSGRSVGLVYMYRPLTAADAACIPPVQA